VTGDATPQEIEVKLPAADLEAIRARLRRDGGELERERHDESNDLYDDSQGRIAAAGCALRVRRVPGRTILTFKGPGRFEKGVKTREERETDVADPVELGAILERLGFGRTFRYEKRREEWRFAGCAVALDETPIGDFIEIEGNPSAIRRAVTALELDFASAIPYSYARLYAMKRRDDSSLPRDMVWGAEPGAPARRVSGERPRE
jgi:adenylate cyclase class 2